jgi:hypothetical protein
MEPNKEYVIHTKYNPTFQVFVYYNNVPEIQYTLNFQKQIEKNRWNQLEFI